jgi:hypothetical protein
MNEVLEDLSVLRHNRRYRIWRPFMQKYDCQVIAEIGVRKGTNFVQMIKHSPKLAVAVDCWQDDGMMARNDMAFKQEELDRQYEELRKNMADKEFVQIYREYSFEAVKRFPDNYFDLVYIDADHTLEGCYRDICDWYPKIKPGKFLLGDDFRNKMTHTRVRFGVVDAVSRFAREMNLSFFVFQPSKWGIIKP